MKTKIIVLSIALFAVGTIAQASWFSDLFNKNQVNENLGATVLKVPAGGTGASTFPAGQCLKGNGTGAITTGACGTGGTTINQLGQIGDVSTSTLAGTYGHVLIYNGTDWVDTATSTLGLGGSSGTVSSVNLTVPTGLTYSGGAITTTGTFNITNTAGYSIPLSASTTEGSTAYTWGNHANAGYYVGNGSAFATAAQGSLADTAIQTELDPVWSGASANYLLISNAFTQALASTTFQARNNWTTHDNYPSACTPGQVVSGIGDTLTCVATSTNANTATALAANPNDCTGGQFANAIDASGNLTCATPAGGSGTIATSSILTAGLLVQSTAWNTVANIATNTLNIDLSNTLGTLPVNRGGTGLTSGYNNSNWDSAYGWGNHATQGYEFQSYASSTLVNRGTWTSIDNYPTACTGGQVVSGIGDTLTCISTSTNANTATALAVDPTACTPGQVVTDIAANGTLTCVATSTVSASDSTWTLHNSYPAACSPGQVVSGIGDTLTCVATSTSLSTIGSGSNWSLAVWNGANSLTGVATSTLTPTSPLGGSFTQIGTGGSLTCTTASSGVGGCLSSTAFDTFNGKENVLTFNYPLSRATNAISLSGMATSSPTNGTGISLSGTGAVVGGSLQITNSAPDQTVVLTNGTNINVTGTYPNFTINSTATGGATNFLGSIGDVSTSTLLNGYVLKYNTGTSKWESVATSSLGISGSGNGTFTYYPAFSYATSTAWSGTTTLALGPAYINETWNGIQCFTDTGTVFVQITDGTNVMNSLQASTTVGTVTLSSNNSFSAGEKRYANIGTPASTPTKISCSASRTYTGGGGNGVNPGLVGEFAYYDTTNSVSGTSTLSLNTTTGKISIPSLATPAGTFLALDASGQIISTSTPTGSMTYPGAGIALSTGSAWDTPITNNSANWNTAYGWGNHATAGYELQAYASSSLVSRTDWTTHDSYPAACTNQFIRTIGDTNTCDTVGAADVSLANLSATDTTLTFSGTYTGATARTIGLNLSNANTWTGLQTFANASTTNLSSSNASSTLLYMGTGYIPGLGTAAGSFLAVNASGQIIATTTPSGGGYSSLSDLQAAVSNDFHNLGGTDATGGGSSDEKWATSTDTTSIYPAGGTKVGIGTTTPQWPLQISSSNSPQLSLGDGINPQWTFRNAGGNLYIGTSSPDTFATSSINALTINNNGQVLHQVGTVTLPSISFIGDSDTGIYHSAANTVNMGTNGVSRVTVNSNGLSATAIDVTTEQYKWHGSYILGAEDTNNLYVGIGATPPYGSGTGVNNTFVGYMAGGAGEDSISNTYLGASAGWGNVGDYNIGIGDDALGNTTFSNNNIAIGTTVMVGSGSGQNINKNVGIGDLALNNTSFSGDQNIVIGYSAAQSLTTGSNNIIIGVASTTANDNLTTGSGNIKIGHNISFPDATGDYQLNIGNIIYGTNINGTGSTLSTGKIGIGTTTPDYLLTVYGTSSTTLAYINTLNIPTLATPAGAFLAVNASGQIIATTTPSGGTYTAGDFLTLTGSDFDVDTGAIADGATTILATADAIYDFMRTSTSTLSSYYLPITGGTGTGTYDFGGATALEIPNGTAPVFSAVGQIGFDTTDNQFLIGTSTSNDPAVIPTRIKLFGGGLASTSVDFVSGGVIPTSQQIDGFIIDYISCQVDSGTSVTINFSNVAGTSDSNSVVCDVGGQTDLVTANRTYTAGSFNRIEISGVSGAVDYLTYSVWGYITRE